MVPAFFALFGLIAGSFFNVLICRIPEKKSILFPPSHCPKCKSPIKPWYNVPILGYIILGGKCRVCKQRISITYPLIELTTATAALILWYFYISSQQYTSWIPITILVVQSTFLLLCIPVTIIDFRHYIIPDQMTLPFCALGICISFLPGPLTPLQSLFGIVAGGGTLYAIGWIGTLLLKKEAMGGGDIKLMAAAGALFGAQNALLSIIIGAMLGSIFGITAMMIKKMDHTHQIPFGPFLAAGIWTALLAGQKLLDAYLSLLAIN
jgi:leader peptidase (prepilin peptidase)/N-methyltransferase